MKRNCLVESQAQSQSRFQMRTWSCSRSSLETRRGRNWVAEAEAAGLRIAAAGWSLEAAWRFDDAGVDEGGEVGVAFRRRLGDLVVVAVAAAAAEMRQWVGLGSGVG